MISEGIDYDELHVEATMRTFNQIDHAAKMLANFLDLDESPKEAIREHPMLGIGIALLKYSIERDEVRRLMKEAELEILRGVSDNLEILASTVMQLMVAKLKENWLKTFPNHTPAEMAAAMRYFDSMAIKNSRLGHADE